MNGALTYQLYNKKLFLHLPIASTTRRLYSTVGLCFFHYCKHKTIAGTGF